MSNVHDVKSHAAAMAQALDALTAAHDAVREELDARIGALQERVAELQALLVEEQHARHAAATELAEMKAGTRGT